MKDKLVSIIIPVYNTENYINMCVKSIVAQTYSNIEIILVDDGSTDASAKLCDDWATKDKRIFVLHQRNSGVSAARNSGIEYASGKWIIFVDADDIIKVTDTSTVLINQLISNFNVMEHAVNNVMDRISAIKYSSKAAYFLNAKVAHLKFMYNVYQNYINDNFISLPDHFNCAFGKFYYSSGKEMFGKDADFNNIEQVHAQVHSLGHRIMQCISEKRKEDAVQDLEELQNTVSNLIEILDKLIDKYNI